jgi:hypothetical protein
MIKLLHPQFRPLLSKHANVPFQFQPNFHVHHRGGKSSARQIAMHARNTMIVQERHDTR